MATETAPQLEKPAGADPAAAAAVAAPVDPKAPHPAVPELMKLFLEDVPPEQRQESPEAKAKKETEAKENAAKEKTRLEAEAKAKKEAETPIKVRKKPAEQRPALPLEPKREEAPARVERAARQEETVDDAELEPEEKQMIADAEEAERLFPEKHKGLGARAKDYVKRHIAFIKAHGGDDKFDPDDPEVAPEYQRFLDQFQPRLDPVSAREISEKRIAAQVEERTKPELERIRDQRYVDREEPEVVKHASQTYNRLAVEVTPAEIKEDIKKRGYAAASADYKLELGVIHGVLTGAADDVAEFERLSRINPETGRPLAKETTDPANPKHAQHQRLRVMTHEICEEFKNTGGAELKRGDKWFVTKSEWLKIKQNHPEALGNYWTFSNREIIDRALKKVPAVVAAAIARKIKDQEDLGFVRRPREVKKEEPKPGDKGAPKAPHPSAAPGGSGGGDQPLSDGAKLAAILKND